jgi:hypothetical protein
MVSVCTSPSPSSSPVKGEETPPSPGGRELGGGGSRTWIPASAGMTGQVTARGRTGFLRSASATPWNPSLTKRDLGSSEGRGLTHPPCRDGAAGCCREFEGVPQFSFLLSPKIGGQRGLKRAPREGRWVSRPLYPHYTWIPAKAGMTEVEKGD